MRIYKLRRRFEESLLMLAYRIVLRATRRQPCAPLQRIVDAFEQARAEL